MRFPQTSLLLSLLFYYYLHGNVGARNSTGPTSSPTQINNSENGIRNLDSNMIKYEQMLKKVNSTTVVTTEEYGVQTTEIYNNGKREPNSRVMSKRVILLKKIDSHLWRYVPPVLMAIGVLGNGMTILVMRRYVTCLCRCNVNIGKFYFK